MKNQLDLNEELSTLFEKLNELIARKDKLHDEIDVVLNKIRSIQQTLDLLKGKTSPPDQDAILATKLNENTKLGDAIEAIITAKGALRRKEIIEILQKYHVRISPKSPEQVLANALKRDAKERFVTLKDRRVGLRRGNE